MSRIEILYIVNEPMAKDLKTIELFQYGPKLHTLGDSLDALQRLIGNSLDASDSV